MYKWQSNPCGGDWNHNSDGCVRTVHACALTPCICAHIYNWHEHIHRYTWEQRADYINAIWGECLGSTAQHILCVSRPSEIRFMDGCGTTRWGPEQWLFVCCFFLLAVIIAPPPPPPLWTLPDTQASMPAHTCTHLGSHRNASTLLQQISTCAFLEIETYKWGEYMEFFWESWFFRFWKMWDQDWSCYLDFVDFSRYRTATLYKHSNMSILFS